MSHRLLKRNVRKNVIRGAPQVHVARIDPLSTYFRAQGGHGYIPTVQPCPL